jgi:hypothetical protein
MEHAARFLKLIFCLALLPTGLAFSQTTPDEVAPAVTAAPVAYVYIGTTKGVYLYDAASTGKLTRVSSSAYHPAGLAIGSNGKYFISLGTDYVHSYKLGSNGAIGASASEINTQYYYASQCGTTGGAVLDHTGQDVYVRMYGAFVDGTAICTGFQTFKIGSTGALTFNGATIATTDKYSCCDSGGTLLTITGNDARAYSTKAGGYAPWSQIIAFSRNSSGTLEFTNFNEVDPPGVQYEPLDLAADPTNHLAVSVDIADAFSPIQLASYTVNSGTGDIVSTNTAENMPTPNMSPSGKLLAAASMKANLTASKFTTGLQIFHFNGVAPITHYSAVLTTTPIDEIHWDNSNHLYALSNTKDKLYVFTVTPTSIKAVSGSPFTVGSSTMGTPNSLIVVSKIK